MTEADYAEIDAILNWLYVDEQGPETLRYIVPLKSMRVATAALLLGLKQKLIDAERLKVRMMHEMHEVEQIAGKALGYPWYKDDQLNFTGATEADGVCIGEHVPVTIVAELAAKLAEFRKEVQS
jgi:hypothetical protein